MFGGGLLGAPSLLERVCVCGQGCLALQGIRVITQGGDLVPTMPRCVCQNVKDMGPFSASRE